MLHSRDIGEPERSFKYKPPKRLTPHKFNRSANQITAGGTCCVQYCTEAPGVEVLVTQSAATQFTKSEYEQTNKQ